MYVYKTYFISVCVCTHIVIDGKYIPFVSYIVIILPGQLICLKAMISVEVFQRHSVAKKYKIVISDRAIIMLDHHSTMRAYSEFPRISTCVM